VSQTLKLAAIVTLIDKLSGPAGRMTGAMSKLQKTVEMGKKVTEFGQRMGVSAVLVDDFARRARGALGSMMGPLMSLEDRSAELSTVMASTMGGVEQSMEAAQGAALAWADKHRQAADKFIGASYLMASAGLADTQAIAGTEAALALATATMGDNATAANLLATMYNNLGDKGRDVSQEMQRLGDMTTKTQQAFQIRDLGQLNEGLKYGIPSAKQYRMELAELYTVVGALNTAGLQGSMAGTALSATMRNILKAADQLGFGISRTRSGGIDLIGTLANMRGALGDFGDMSDDVKQQVQKAFGEEGVRAVALLMGQTDELRHMMGEVVNSTGAMQAGMEAMENTTSAKWDIISNRVNRVKMTLAEKLMPVIEALVPTIMSALTAFAGFADTHPQLLETGMLLFGIGTIGLTIMAPLLQAGAAITMFAGYGIQAIGHLGRVLAFAGGLVLQLGAWIGSALVGAMPGLVAGLGAAATATWAWTAALLANPMTWVIGGVVALGAGIYLLVKHWDTVRAAFSAAYDWILGATDGLVTTMGDWWAQLEDGSLAVVNAIIDGVLGVPDAFNDAIDAAMSWLDGLWGEFKASGVGLVNAFVDGIKSAAMAPVEAVQDMLANVREYLPFSDAHTGPLSNLTQSGRAFWATWAGGLKNSRSVEDGIGSVMAYVRRAATIPQQMPFQAAAPAAPAVNMALNTGSREDGRKIHIENLHVQMNNVQDGERFVEDLRRLTREVG